METAMESRPAMMETATMVEPAAMMEATWAGTS